MFLPASGFAESETHITILLADWICCDGTKK